jgi:hypothetical protein
MLFGEGDEVSLVEVVVAVRVLERVVAEFSVFAAEVLRAGVEAGDLPV